MERPKPGVLEWEDIREAAGELFDVWMNGSDMRWAEEGWALLTQAGLAQYDNGVGRCRATLFLLAMAALYRDFCFLAWDEYAPLDLSWGADVLQVSPLRVGQLAGVGDPAIDERDDDEALKFALLRLVGEARALVLDVLIKEYGGVTGLFVALWRTSELGHQSFFQMQLFEESRPQLTDWGVVNLDIGWGKLRAYEWLAGGGEGII